MSLRQTARASLEGVRPERALQFHLALKIVTNINWPGNVPLKSSKQRPMQLVLSAGIQCQAQKIMHMQPEKKSGKHVTGARAKRGKTYNRRYNAGNMLQVQRRENMQPMPNTRILAR